MGLDVKPPDVNAAVFYNESLLSLFLPASKNLVIGLGLVNRLNLSEFKAVLAHEFGHFSQSSMKLGTYVYTANRILADIVYARDRSNLERLAEDFGRDFLPRLENLFERVIDEADAEARDDDLAARRRLVRRQGPGLGPEDVHGIEP